MPDKSLDESKTIKAVDLVNNSDQLPFILQPCILVMDTSMSMSFNNFVAAVNLLMEDGWRVDPPMMNGAYLMALCHNPRYKRKREAMAEEEK